MLKYSNDDERNVCKVREGNLRVFKADIFQEYIMCIKIGCLFYVQHMKLYQSMYFTVTIYVNCKESALDFYPVLLTDSNLYIYIVYIIVFCFQTFFTFTL